MNHEFTNYTKRKKNKLECKICNYISTKKSDILKHFETKKHKNNKKNEKKRKKNEKKMKKNEKKTKKNEKKTKNEINVEEENENLDKIEKIVVEEYICNICNYTSCKKYNFFSHLTTKKHMNAQKKCSELKKLDGYYCCCGKKYKYSSGLSKHKLRCKFYKEFLEENNEINIVIDDDVSIANDGKVSNNSLGSSSENLNEVLINFMKTQNEINQKLLENISNTTIYNNCSTNKMTINVFLNEKCKNAMNLSDFMNTLDISIDDLMYTKEHGYIAGINNIFTKNIIKIDPTDRPFHCNTNEKLFYVKDSNIWVEDDKNAKMDETISNVSCKQIKKIQDWIKLNPDYLKDEKKMQVWQKMVHNMIGDPTEDMHDKEEIMEYLSQKVAMNDDLLSIK